MEISPSLSLWQVGKTNSGLNSAPGKKANFTILNFQSRTEKSSLSAASFKVDLIHQELLYFLCLWQSVEDVLQEIALDAPPASFAEDCTNGELWELCQVLQ